MPGYVSLQEIFWAMWAWTIICVVHCLIVWWSSHINDCPFSRVNHLLKFPRFRKSSCLLLSDKYVILIIEITSGLVLWTDSMCLAISTCTRQPQNAHAFFLLYVLFPVFRSLDAYFLDLTRKFANRSNSSSLSCLSLLSTFVDLKSRRMFSMACITSAGSSTWWRLPDTKWKIDLSRNNTIKFNIFCSIMWHYQETVMVIEWAHIFFCILFNKILKHITHALFF